MDVTASVAWARFVGLWLALTTIRLTASEVVLNDDGAWNWLQDERVVVGEGRVIAASVALGQNDPARTGDIEVTSHDRRNGAVTRFTLHHEKGRERALRWADDHSCPALLVRPDGRLLAMYNIHGQEPNFYYRISREPGDINAWEDERVFALPAGSRVAFPTLVRLAAENEGRGRTLGFFRGLQNQLMPAWAWSEDDGREWRVGGVVVAWPTKATPYVKYVGDGRTTVHLAFTDGHRVDFNNALFHAIYRDGQLWRSDGQRIGTMAEGIRSIQDATEVFRANADSVAMISDLELDADGRPCVVYSVQMNTRRLRPRPIGADHRYRYARWTGREWRDGEIAHAGTETHDAPDDDCTGQAAIDPQDVNVVYVSTNSDPTTGVALISRVDQKRHWEIFRGVTADGGTNWRWTAVTRDSISDHLRPIIPRGAPAPSPVLWLRGTMQMPRQSRLEVVTWVAGERDMKVNPAMVPALTPRTVP